MKKKFILWDNDGVLVETEQLYYQASLEVLEPFDIKIEMDQYLEMMARGGSCWEFAQAKGIARAVINRLREARDRRYQELLRCEDIEIEGVCDTLRELSESYRMAIVTTSRRPDFQIIHGSREIVNFMEFVLTVEDYPKAKPAPDPYLAALDRFEAARESAIVIEDSSRGLGSARAAGIDCVIVENQFTLSQDFTGAAHRVTSIRDLPALLRRL